MSARKPKPAEHPPARPVSWRVAGWAALIGLSFGLSFGVVFGVTKYMNRPTTPTTDQPPEAPPAGMVWVPGGEFEMGSALSRVEQPVHKAAVRGFFMDATEVTNAHFRAFVAATGYVTTAEKVPAWDELKKTLPPGTPKPTADKLRAGSLVFTPPAGKVPLTNAALWWRWVPGADWKHPDGPTSNLVGRDDHPVVQVSWDDAVAYAAWAGKRLPTETEWEYACRGGLAGKRYPWGDDKPDGQTPLTNIWQGTFPTLNTKADGFDRTAPVGTYPANGYGLHDMAGNVWEWCADWYRADAYTAYTPAGPAEPWDPNEPHSRKRVTRGGSFLCHEDYCESYRPAARRGTDHDTGMSHIGFRCVKSPIQEGSPE